MWGRHIRAFPNYLVAHPTNRKWVITPVINGISRVNPLITGVITHLLSGMSHQVGCWETCRVQFPAVFTKFLLAGIMRRRQAYLVLSGVVSVIGWLGLAGWWPVQATKEAMDGWMAYWVVGQTRWFGQNAIAHCETMYPLVIFNIAMVKVPPFFRKPRVFILSETWLNCSTSISRVGICYMFLFWMVVLFKSVGFLLAPPSSKTISMISRDIEWFDHEGTHFFLRG